MRLYFKLVSITIKSQMQHRASFLMTSTAFFFSTFMEILAIWVLFDRFNSVQGWTIEEVALVYGIIHMGFSCAECTARGFDTFHRIVRNGDFDRILLRPHGTLLQVASKEFQIMRIGRFFQGLFVLLWGCFELNLSLFSNEGCIIPLAIIGTACFFYGLFVIQATLSFWTTENLELMNIFTYGGVEAGQYPMSLYKPAFKFFFTFVVPLACVAYFPVATMLNHESLPLIAGFCLPLVGFLFLLLSCQLWKLGVRRYHSTGS